MAGMRHFGLCIVLSATLASAQSVLQMKNTQARQGLYTTSSSAAATVAASSRVTNISTPLPGEVYGQVLYVAGSSLDTDRVIVATQENRVLSINPATGAVVWDVALLPAVPATALPCGDIDPVQGITGTPVIDPRGNGTIYVGAVTTADNGTTIKQMVYALHLADGSTLQGWPVDVETALAGQTFLSVNQNQRGALTLLNDTVYVPYGGLDGDCATYWGWVVGINTTTLTAKAFRTAAAKGGIWTPGGVSSDGTSMFAVSGNTDGATYWQDGNGVFKFQPGPVFTNESVDYFAPAAWKEYDDNDVDLCGSEPIVLDLPGSTPSQLLLQTGKDGNVWVLDRQNLGGIGGQLFVKQASKSVIIDVPTVYTTSNGTYMAFRSGGLICPAGSPSGADLMSIRIIPGSPPSWEVAWCAVQDGTGSPMSTTADNQTAIVWGLGAETSGQLLAFDGDTGRQLFASEAVTGIQRFHTPMVARDRVYFAATNLTAFTIGGAATTATPAASTTAASPAVTLQPPGSTSAAPSPSVTASQPASAPSAGAASQSSTAACLLLLLAAAMALCSM